MNLKYKILSVCLLTTMSIDMVCSHKKSKGPQMNANPLTIAYNTIKNSQETKFELQLGKHQGETKLLAEEAKKAGDQNNPMVSSLNDLVGPLLNNFVNPFEINAQENCQINEQEEIKGDNVFELYKAQNSVNKTMQDLVNKSLTHPEQSMRDLLLHNKTSEDLISKKSIQKRKKEYAFNVVAKRLGMQTGKSMEAKKLLTKRKADNSKQQEFEPNTNKKQLKQ